VVLKFLEPAASADLVRNWLKVTIPFSVGVTQFEHLMLAEAVG